MWKKGSKLRIFPETDVDSYVRYFEMQGLECEVCGSFILITGKARPRPMYSMMKTPNKQEIGKRIKRIRTQMYFSIKELAEEIDVDAALITAWEEGRELPKGKSLEKFCDFSKATKEYILEGKGEWVDEIKQLMSELHE